MAVYLPVEILSLIFTSLIDDLLGAINPLRKNGVRDAYGLLLVSRSVRAIVEPILYRTISEPTDRRLRVLFRSMNLRPELAAMVREIDLAEDGLTWSEDEGEDEDDEDEDSSSDEYRPSPDIQNPSRSEIADAAGKLLKNKFETNGERIQSLEQDCLEKIKKFNPHAMRWALLSQLSNLTSLMLTARSGSFAIMAMLLRLPRLEQLSFTNWVGTRKHWEEDFPPEDILESIISSTKRLKYLKWEVRSGSCSFPLKHDTPKLKQIIERHAAGTLEHLEIVCGLSDERDWYIGQECIGIDIDGGFGSMLNFTNLASLYIQLEVLLGKPEDEIRLKDVLPPQLQHFTGFSLPGCHWQREPGRIWEEEDYLPQFEELAAAAKHDQRLASLQSVQIHRTRNEVSGYCSPGPGRSGDYEDGILGHSRIRFGWF
ncbi:hypothetical protein BJX76DRAFT_360587 [Aspergillus varians]